MTREPIFSGLILSGLVALAPLAAPAQDAPATAPAPTATPAAPAQSVGQTGTAGPPQADRTQAADTDPGKSYPTLTPEDPATWGTFNGDLAAQKFASSDQITPKNVGQLTRAWDVHTGDYSDGSGDKPESVWSATPLFVNDTVYVSTPFYRIIALAPDTGKIKWTFDSKTQLKALTQPALKTRGVAYWQAADPQAGQPCQKIVYLGTMDAHIFAVDADTGKACQGFGKDGVIDVNQWNPDAKDWPLSILQPPTVWKNTMYVGWAGKDWALQKAPPGSVFAIDTRTGELKWTYDTIPKDEAKSTGTANVWASMSIDRQRGILYLPVSSPSPNYWGGNRTEDIPDATSVTAIDAASGKALWTRQLIHHDIWDYDTNAAPTLVDLKRDGKVVPALVQTTKQGFLYVLNRVTGQPVFPITEHPVPPSDAEGEKAAPTQPWVSTPEPVVPDEFPGIFDVANWASFGQCSRDYAKMKDLGKYTPPSTQGTIAFPGTSGGVEWGGGAVDPSSGIYYVNNSRVAQIYQLVPKDQFDQHKDDPNFYPQTGAPYGVVVKTFLNSEGMPCWNPPYGNMSAYDLNTGRLLWRVPYGQVQKWGFYMPESWGSPTIGGPVVTKTGVLFAGGSMDARVRALDAASGKVLWKAQVMAPAVSMPAVYTFKGREYVVFAAGGNSILKPQVGDELVAFALPAK